MDAFDELRSECCAANRALGSSGLVDLTFGNVSLLDPVAGVFAIKPSGVPYDQLRDGDMVVLDLEGKIVFGKLRPSSDAPTHRRIFLGFDGVRSIVHTHSRCAVTFAQAAHPIPLLGTTHADYFRGPIPVTRSLTEREIQEDYEWATGEVIVEAFQSICPLDIPAVLVRNHGPFAWGDTGQRAVETALALELVAHMALDTLKLNPAAASPPHGLSEKHFLRKHGPNAYYGQHRPKG